MGLPLVIQKDGTIYFYKGMIEKDKEINISKYLKETAIQIEYLDRIEVYKIEDFSIISFILNNQDIDDFIKYLENYSYNKIDNQLVKHIRTIENTMKIVSLELGKTEIIIRVLKGDFSFLETDRKLKGKIQKNNKEAFYTYPREGNNKLIDYLANKKVSMTLPNENAKEEISIHFNKPYILRYYQEQALNILKNTNKGLIVMPVASGKTYVATSLIEYLNKRTLIFCEGKDNCLNWKKFLLESLSISEEDISVCVDSSCDFKLGKINILSYDYVRKDQTNSRFEELYNNIWGVIIYDDSHKVVTDKAVDLLYLKSEYKYAFASTLNRSDGKEESLLYLFGGIKYYVSSKELVNNLFLKKIECYRVDLRNNDISEYDFLKKISYKNKEKSLVIVAYYEKDIEEISQILNINSLYNKTNIQNNNRLNLIEKFNNRKINRLCISVNFAEKYSVTNIDIMISAGYRGGKGIEEEFKIGTLISTKEKLDKITTVQMFYLIDSDSDYSKVNKKEKIFKSYGFIFNKLDINRYIGEN